MEKRIKTRREERRNKMTASKEQSASVLPVAQPRRGKTRGTCRQYSEQKLQQRSGGTCMHKTDGKLFCVAAPIPGAGAGEGECVGGWRSMRWEAAQGQPNAPH